MEVSKDQSRYHEDTELRLGLPGSKKRSSSTLSEESTSGAEQLHDHESAPKRKVQAIGWPPVRSYRKNCLEASSTFVKVSVDGAPYLRKVDLKLYKGYNDLLTALEDMFKFKPGKLSNRETQSNELEYKPTYEDKDGDWMLVGDVPWEMFIISCKRLRFMKGSEPNNSGCLASNLS